MKNLCIILSLFATIAVIGCKKDSNSSLAAGKSRISLDASGATSGSFASDDRVSTVAKSGSIINISGASLGADMVMMLLPATITTGTYDLSTLSSSAAGPTFSYSKGANGWAAVPGDHFTIIVTKATSTEIEGTFSGTAHNDDAGTDVTISNGKFAAKY